MKKDNKNPLAEVFGFLTTDKSDKANRFRHDRLCPFNNKVPNCTKDKAKNPLGVCSIYHESAPVITCPIRFREDWTIAGDAASFFFNNDAKWSSLTEVRMLDSNGKAAGNIDVVLAAYDAKGKIYDFGSLEIQAVYISGNVRDPFEFYMESPDKRGSLDWSDRPNFPRPDYLSSSRKRLAPQLIFKGGILKSWNKKMAVALSESFFATLPAMNRVKKSDADLVWLVYGLEEISEENGEQKRFALKKVDEVYTRFESALLTITTPSPGKIDDFLKLLQEKLDERLETPPNNKTIDKPF